MVYKCLDIARLRWPTRCVLCGAPGQAGLDLCVGCRRTLPRNAASCSRCALPLPADSPIGTRCGGCTARPPAFDLALAPYRYESPVSDLVLGLKYAGRLAYGRILGHLLASSLAPAASDRPEALLPVPLHPARLRQRGFNQATEIARQVSRHLRIPVLHDALQRIENTAAQAGLRRAARLRNLGRAFRWTGPSLAAVAVIDDVMTTGATAEAIARTLKRAGLQRVEIWTVARTPHRPG